MTTSNRLMEKLRDAVQAWDDKRLDAGSPLVREENVWRAIRQLLAAPARVPAAPPRAVHEGKCFDWPRSHCACYAEPPRGAEPLVIASLERQHAAMRLKLAGALEALALAQRERDRLQAQITNGGCVDHRDYLDACEERDQFQRERDIELDRATHYRDQWQEAQRTVAQLRAAMKALLAKWDEASVWESENSNVQWAQALDSCIADLRAALAAGDAPEEPEPR